MNQRTPRLAKRGNGDSLLAVVALASLLGTAGLIFARAVGTAGIIAAVDYLSPKEGSQLGASYQGYASLE